MSFSTEQDAKMATEMAKEEKGPEREQQQQNNESDLHSDFGAFLKTTSKP